ncbi:hypothetical protein EDS67_27450 [candidate division KSB1 bacterium]|nr:MAG: hypothetical protein EDS67_27450 [candidate division KSB1 bacterium]MBC6951315.1 hypothetical protein [candidate division KSB1 bacterium]MCE7945418.1 hypothetical protein [Chlorobi bacterium CHB1]MDL1878747.1 hypothetical protein [Cytophagia bacterium CHB2]
MSNNLAIMNSENGDLAQQPHFVPAASDLKRISPAELTSLLLSFRRPAIGFAENANEWQCRSVQAWHAVARAWENWQFPEAEVALRRLQANTRMSLPVLRESIANHFREITADAINAWLDEVREARADEPDAMKYPSLVFVIASGNIPGAALQQVVQLSLLGIPTLVKSASAEPDFMPAVFSALAQQDAEVASRLMALSWPRENNAATAAVLALSPRVIALGDDDTMQQLRAEAGSALMPFGDRFSAAIIHAKSVKIQALRKLVYDYAMFDGKGCLAPQVVMVIAEQWPDVEQLATHFAGILAEESAKWPAGNWSAQEHALIQQWRGEWQARRAAGENIALFQPADTSWTVVAAEEFDLEQRIAFRAVRLLWVKSFDDVMLILKNYSAKIQALAVEIQDHEHAQLVLDLDEQEEVLGRIICEPGALQRPAFAWMAISRQWFELIHGVKL